MFPLCILFRLKWVKQAHETTRRHSVERIHSPCHKVPLSLSLSLPLPLPETDYMCRVTKGSFKDTLPTQAHFVPDPHMGHVETDSVRRVIYISVWSDLHFHCCASNNGMLTSALSIVVRQTMACWHPHFPLLCAEQWHADVSTFHCCVSNNGMLMSALFIVCLSTQRLTSFLIHIWIM